MVFPLLVSYIVYSVVYGPLKIKTNNNKEMKQQVFIIIIYLFSAGTGAANASSARQGAHLASMVKTNNNTEMKQQVVRAQVQPIRHQHVRVHTLLR